MASAKNGTEKESARVVESEATPGAFRTDNDDTIKKVATEVIETTQSALTTVNDMDYAADAGRGMEGATQESFAIPFLIVLQKNSPQVDEMSGVAIEGARQGMLFNTVTGQIYDVAKKPLVIVPCAYKRTFIRWGSRKAGGGFKGELTEAQINEMRERDQLKDVDGKLLVPDSNGALHEKCDAVNDHRNHYVLILDEETGAWQEAMISLTSTQIKKSRQLMSAIASVKMQHPQTKMIFQPPSWANKVKVGTQPEQNEKGSWMGITFGLAGRVDRKDVYEAGKVFSQSVQKGAITENYNNLAENAPNTAEPETGGAKPSHSQPEKL